MDEKFVRETIDNYDKVDDRACHVAELLKIVKGCIDTVVFNADNICYTFSKTCMGYTDYDYDWLPIRYMWMDDNDIIEDYKKMKEAEIEAERKRKEKEKEKKEAAKKKREEMKEKSERDLYEKLKKKFENQ